MRHAYHPEAESELLEATSYYRECSRQAAERFALEVTFAVQRILSLPKAWPIVDGDIRRCLLSRFPYALFYRVEQGKVRIYAVAHLRRRPGYWRYRRSE